MLDLWPSPDNLWVERGARLEALVRRLLYAAMSFNFGLKASDRIVGDWSNRELVLAAVAARFGTLVKLLRELHLNTSYKNWGTHTHTHIHI